MQGIQNFDPADFPLMPVRIETWEGFVFVNFDPGAESLAEYLGNLPDLLHCYNFSNMVCTRRKTYSVACNWKLIVENAMEDYHTGTVHRASIGTQKIVLEIPSGNWEAGHYATEKSIATLPGEKAAFSSIPR